MSFGGAEAQESLAERCEYRPGIAAHEQADLFRPREQRLQVRLPTRKPVFLRMRLLTSISSARQALPSSARISAR